MVAAALDGHIDLVVDLVGPGFVGVASGGGPPATLLHYAAWSGSTEVVGVLLARGADPLARSNDEFATPAAWCALASRHWRLPGRDYVAVMEQLVAAGAELEPRFQDVAQGPLHDWLA